MRGGGATSALELQVIAAEVRTLYAAVDRLMVSIAERVAVLHAENHCVSEGYEATGEWIRFECRQPSAASYGVVAVGERMEEIGATLAAMAAGEIGSATSPTSPGPAERWTEGHLTRPG